MPLGDGRRLATEIKHSVLALYRLEQVGRTVQHNTTGPVVEDSLAALEGELHQALGRTLLAEVAMAAAVDMPVGMTRFLATLQPVPEPPTDTNGGTK